MLLLVILSRWVCFLPEKWCRFIINIVDCYSIFFCFLVSHECDHSFGSLLTSKLLFRATILSPYNHPRNPASELVFCSGHDTVYGNWYCSNTAPLSPLLATGGPPVKIIPGSLYDSAVLIAPEYGNTRSIWHPPCCAHRWSGCCPRCNCLATEENPQSILPYGCRYQKWKAITKVRPSSRGDSGFPLGLGLPFRPGDGNIRKSALTGPVVVYPLLVVLFWGLSVTLSHI